MNEIVKLLKVLANNKRLSILNLLQKDNTLTVNDISYNIKLSVKSTSKHLRLLYISKIITCNKVKNYVYYSIKPDNNNKILEYVLETIKS